MENDKPIQFLILTDGWRFIRKYMNRFPMDDDGFQELINEAQALYEQYGKTAFAEEVALCCLDELERISKEVGNNGKIK